MQITCIVSPLGGIPVVVCLFMRRVLRHVPVDTRSAFVHVCHATGSKRTAAAEPVKTGLETNAAVKPAQAESKQSASAKPATTESETDQRHDTEESKHTAAA
jgi:hypothetical protein